MGCRKCVYACVKENNQSRDPQIQYIRVLQMRKGSIDVESSSTEYTGEVPKDGFYYMPVQCHQCRKAPCVEVCPTGARKFGNLLDPESEISNIIKTKKVYVLKEEVGTLPRFYYYFDL